MPWYHREWFAQRGLNVNDTRFGTWVRGGGNGGHQSWSVAYNNVWSEFIGSNSNATSQQVIEFLNYVRTNPMWGGGF